MAPFYGMHSDTRLSLALLPLLAAALVSATNARADFFTHSWQDQREAEDSITLGVQASYYGTTSNFDSAGSTVVPLGFDKYWQIQTDFTAKYGMTDRLTLFGRLNWKAIKAEADSTVSTSTGSSYGLGDQTVALNYRILQRRTNSTAIDLQAQVDFPAYSNSDSARKQTPFLGDGTTDLTAGAFVNVPITERNQDELVLVGGAGYTYRNQGFSAAVPWSASLEYAKRGPGIFGSLSLFGAQSLKTDENRNNLTMVNNTAGSEGSGGSYITNAIDPSVFNVGGKLGYRMKSDWTLYATVQQAVVGTSAPKGFLASLGATVHLGPKDHPRDPVKMTPAEYGKSNQGFVDYDLDAKVMRANDRFSLIKIDKGTDSGVAVGNVFDIFITNTDGTAGPAIARGHVTNVRDTESAVKIDEYFKEIWIEEGFVARRTTQ